MHDMNETDGRSGSHEPCPIASIYCNLKAKSVTIMDARASYTSHNDICIDCQECQKAASNGNI